MGFGTDVVSAEGGGICGPRFGSSAFIIFLILILLVCGCCFII
ncbi:MAG: hypothetical protein A4E53_02152 [Pelotomaculum sp. PtaB.Bin104]|nr:MAG: hypothetical protein A4E53_02152 [Pelotomaculum sp. PtaB.Bin104]